jgi:hypothetical protein
MTTTTKPAARYTEVELKKAEQMRKDGESYKAIGLALDIKATAYLSTILKKREAERASAAKTARKPRAKKVATAA